MPNKPSFKFRFGNGTKRNAKYQRIYITLNNLFTRAVENASLIRNGRFGFSFVRCLVVKTFKDNNKKRLYVKQSATTPVHTNRIDGSMNKNNRKTTVKVFKRQRTRSDKKTKAGFICREARLEFQIIHE